MNSVLYRRLTVVVTLGFLVTAAAWAGDAKVSHHYADNDGVKIHYAKAGETGPLVVMIHGFPDFWYSWNEQLKALQSTHRVVAMDLRGYNRSDKPKGLEQYAMPRLVSDVAAVIRGLPLPRRKPALAWRTAPAPSVCRSGCSRVSPSPPRGASTAAP